MTASFSERIGAKPVPAILQLDAMDDALRNSLWNFIYTIGDSHVTGSTRWIEIAKSLAIHVRKSPVDEVARIYNHEAKTWVKEFFTKSKWHVQYDILEHLVKNAARFRGDFRFADAASAANAVLEEERSGYRFIGGQLAPISSQIELDEIAQGIQQTENAGLAGANEHLRKAVELLSDKPVPDYRNSIKESISAIESIAKVIGDDNSSGLKGALDELSKKTKIHGSLSEGFKKLYGYTSDEGGIRHAITSDEQQSPGFDEAKYMLVSCSAFANYLISKARTSGIL